MAKRKKTIRFPFAFGNVLDKVGGGTVSIGTQSISISENSPISVTFSSVQLYIAVQDKSAGALTISGFTASVFIGVTGPTGGSPVGMGSSTLPNSGENWGGIIGPIDYASYFNRSFGTGGNGRLVTVNGRFAAIGAASGLTARGVYPYMDITYVYDDSSPRRTDSVCVPYESSTTTLPTTPGVYAVMPKLTGTNGWLNSYANLEIQARWIELKGNVNVNNTATTNGITISYSIDGGGIGQLPARVTTAASDTWQLYQIDALTYSTDATHSLLLGSSLASRWTSIVVNEWITYSYDVIGTTASLNYIELPMEFSSPVSPSQSRPSRYYKDFDIQEPGPIVLRKAAVQLNYTNDASATLLVRGGSQSFRTYAQSSNVVAGQFSLQHGLDPSAVGLTGIRLNRGINQIYIDAYRTTGTVQSCSGVIKVLYESGVSPIDIGAHNQTVFGHLKNISFTASTDESILDSFLFPEDNWYINGAGLKLNYWATTISLAGPIYLATRMSVENIDNSTGGWRELGTDGIVGDAELQYGEWHARLRPELMLYPQDPTDDKISITQSRWYRTSISSASRYGMSYLISYHSITNTVSGTIYGSRGATVSLRLFEVQSDNKVDLYAITSRIGNGTFSFTVYDDSATYRVTAYESSTRKGISTSGLVGSSFNINLISNQTSGFGGG